jgi:2-keto-4-pentenoate hydratase/2-oxohepta-3-ene-1,7-dioic acid hydratase in catechol pathway
VFLARVSYQSEVHYAVVEGLDTIGDTTPLTEFHFLQEHPLITGIRTTGVIKRLDEVKILVPLIPTKVIGIGKNYADHAKEMGGEVPVEPICFLKPTTALIAEGDAIRLPRQSSHVEHESELAVIISKTARNVSKSEAMDYVFGYSVANDVTARDIQKTDGQWTRAKGFDTFLPLGPWIQTDFDYKKGFVEAKVNGVVKQHASLDLMVHDVETLVSWCSESMTLLPGDVILTGTPAGVSPIRAGDEVECFIPGVGRLVNTVVG